MKRSYFFKLATSVAMCLPTKREKMRSFSHYAWQFLQNFSVVYKVGIILFIWGAKCIAEKFERSSTIVSSTMESNKFHTQAEADVETKTTFSPSFSLTASATFQLAIVVAVLGVVFIYLKFFRRANIQVC